MLSHGFVLTEPSLSRILVPGSFDLDICPLVVFQVWDAGVQAYELASFSVVGGGGKEEAKTVVVERCVDVKEHREN